MTVIGIENLTKRYGRRTGVAGLDLEVSAGTVYGFLGPNGAGKTTTIRVLLGLLRPTGGRARVFDLDTWRAGHRLRRDVGYVPGDLRLYPWLTGRSLLDILNRIHGRDLTAAGDELADRFAIELNLPARKMSRGNRQKLGLLLALVHDPKLLILDEPTSGLDPLMQERLKSLVRERAVAGRTVFFSSHSLAEVEQVCDRVAILREGRLVANEDLETLRANARRQVTIRWHQRRVDGLPEPPACLEVHRRDSDAWDCTLTGTAPDFVRWAANQPVADVSIGQPDLEQLFQRYYERQEDAP